MKLGLISDIHGDPVALELAWAHLTVLGADRIVCAGDLVGYGPFPDRVVEFLREHQVPSVRGNHDRWALELPPDWASATSSRAARPSRETLDFLQTLPHDLLVAHEQTIGVVVHGSPSSDMEFVNRHRPIRPQSCASTCPNSVASSSSSGILTSRCGFAVPRDW